MSVQLLFATNMTTKETPTTGAPAVDANQSISQSQYNTSKSLSGTTTPPVSLSAKQVFTLTAGAVSIDLTNLVGLNGAAVSGTGLRVRALKVKAPSGNGAPISVAKGAANGYTGLGASFEVTLPPGGEMTFYDGGGGGVVGGTNKTLDLSGTGSTDTLQTEIVFGT
jgi:hypothetical protein